MAKKLSLNPILHPKCILNCTPGFGIDANALDGSPQGVQFLKMARKVSGADQSAFDIFKAFVTLMLPKSLMKLGPDLINMKAVDFFNSIIDQTLKMRDGGHGTRDSIQYTLESLQKSSQKKVHENVILKKCNASVVGTCLLFKFGIRKYFLVKIFVIFLTVLNCATGAAAWWTSSRRP